jgi:hypothetical protein
MQPVTIQGKPGFPALIRKDLDIDPVFATATHCFRIFREMGTGSRLYLMSAMPKTVQVKGDYFVVYDHLQLNWVGNASFENFFETILALPTFSAALSKAYRSWVQGYSGKGSPPRYETWLRNQYDAWVESGYSVLAYEPVPLTHDCMVHALSYIDDSLIVPGLFPAWENFMSQFEDPADSETFAAFIYAALDETNYGRQVMYIYDNGKTGKSDVCSAITSLLPQVAMGVSAKVIDDRFFNGAVYGKRLLILGDCKNPNILKTERIHSITGNDHCFVERKYQTAFSANLYARVIVMSNYPPLIETYREHETSRILVLKMDHSKCRTKEHYNGKGEFIGNNNFRGELQSQLYHFLHYAKECYEKLCPAHRELTAYTSKSKVVSNTEDIFESVFNEYFTVTGDKKDIIWVSDMYDHLEACMPNFFKREHTYLIHDWKQFLESRGAPYRAVGKPRRRGYIGIRKKDPSVDAPFDPGIETPADASVAVVDLATAPDEAPTGPIIVDDAVLTTGSFASLDIHITPAHLEVPPPPDVVHEETPDPEPESPPKDSDEGIDINDFLGAL